MSKQTAVVNFITKDFSISDLTDTGWQRAQAQIINRHWNGETAPDTRHAVARLVWSETALYLRFDCKQSEPLVANENPQTENKTLKLWERDVCELFLAPDARDPRRYAEFEIAPTGEWLDLMVDWTKEEQRDWDYTSAVEPFARVEGDRAVMAMKIPWTAVERAPAAGDVWAGNMFRQVGSGETRGYLAWSPTMTDQPQFHVPERFGEFVFRR